MSIIHLMLCFVCFCSVILFSGVFLNCRVFVLSGPLYPSLSWQIFVIPVVEVVFWPQIQMPTCRGKRLKNTFDLSATGLLNNSLCP